MAHLPPEAHRFLAAQHGVASVRQLVSTGLTRRQIEHLESRGDLVAVVRGVYGTPSVEPSELGRCAAVCLAHPLVTIAGPTAGRLWGFRRLSTDRRIHVLAPRQWRATAASWCQSYRTDAVHPADRVQRVDGICVTTRQRTAFDLARHLRSDDDLLSVIEQAASDGGLRDGDLRAVAADWVRGRPFARRFIDQVDRRLEGGAAESEPEVVVGDRLARRGVEGLVRQYQVDLPGYGAARFDLAVPRLRIAIEVDVFPTHSEVVGRRRDERRDAAARRIGWTVRRITESAYRTDLQRTLDWIASELDRPAA